MYVLLILLRTFTFAVQCLIRLSNWKSVNYVVDRTREIFNSNKKSIMWMSMALLNCHCVKERKCVRREPFNVDFNLFVDVICFLRK